MANEENRALGWDDTVSADPTEYVLLPKGDYKFKVTNFERARYEGGNKLPPCNKAIIHCEIDSPDGKTTIKTNLYLHSKCEALISSFFISIGLKKHGEPLKMNFPSAVGRYGMCTVSIRNYIDKDGQERQTNEIKRFIESDVGTNNSSTSGRGFTPGVF